MMGAKAGAAEAIQVADRWHLLHNLKEMLERWLATIISKLRSLPVSAEIQPAVNKLMARRYRSSRPTRAAKEAAKANRERRIRLFDEVKQHCASGMSLLSISKKLSMDRKTVRAYAYAESFPERAPRPYVVTILHPYLDYLEIRHAEGCENASQLFREIKGLGFKGTAWHVHRWMQPRRHKPSKHSPRKQLLKKDKQNNPSSSEEAKILVLPSTPQLAWIFLGVLDKRKVRLINSKL